MTIQPWCARLAAAERTWWRTAARHVALCATLGAALGGCGIRQVGDGLPPQGQARFPSVTVITEFPDAARIGAEMFNAASWQIADKAGWIVAETLTAAGGRSLIAANPALPPDDAEGWDGRAIATLRARGEVPDGAAVLLLRELPIDEAGQPHPLSLHMSRTTGYALTVLLDVAAGLSLASGSGAWVYSPTDAGDPLGSMRQHGAMATAPTLHAGRDGRALCDVALSMRLFAADGAVLSSAETVIGQEVLPRLPAAKPWAEMPPADQAMVQTYCTAALRRGVLLAVRAAGVVQ